jgi:hypothetical protein
MSPKYFFTNMVPLFHLLLTIFACLVLKFMKSQHLLTFDRIFIIFLYFAKMRTRYWQKIVKTKIFISTLAASISGTRFNKFVAKNVQIIVAWRGPTWWPGCGRPGGSRGRTRWLRIGWPRHPGYPGTGSGTSPAGLTTTKHILYTGAEPSHLCTLLVMEVESA